MEVDKITDLNEIYFPKLGWRFHIDPTAFNIGNISIQWYGLIITFGLVLALIYCFPRMKRFGLDSDRTVDAVIGGVLGGIVGARAYYVIFNWSEYKGKGFKEIINTRGGGLAIYGGIIGALLVGLIICKLRKIRMLPMLDITVLGFLIGQGIGRWGNFTNQEAFGSNASNFLCMTGGRIQDTILSETQMGGSMYSNGDPLVFWNKAVHPCFLYESLWCLLGFLIISTWSKRRKYDGQILLMYLAWYGAERFIVEGLRTDSLYIGKIRVSQALSAILFIASVIIQIIMFFKVKRDPEKYVLYASTNESRMLIEESRRKRMGLPPEDVMSDDDDDNDYNASDIIGSDDDDDNNDIEIEKTTDDESDKDIKED